MEKQTEDTSGRVILLHGFSDAELLRIMALVKALYFDINQEKFREFVQAASNLPEAGQFSKQLLDLIASTKELPPFERGSTMDLIFAKSTPQSLERRLEDVVAEVTEEHQEMMKMKKAQMGGAPESDPQ